MKIYKILIIMIVLGSVGLLTYMEFTDNFQTNATGDHLLLLPTALFSFLILGFCMFFYHINQEDEK